MKITQIINEHTVIAQEECSGEASYWIKRPKANEEGRLLFAVLEHAFETIERRFGIGAADVSVLTYRRFAEHLRTSVRRALRAETRASATDGTLGGLIRRHMPDCYACAGEIRADLERRCDARLPEDEMLDLMLHVHKVISVSALRHA